MNVLIPLAGRGTRFVEAGYERPKPLIDVLGKPMIGKVIENIGLPRARHIFIVLKKHMRKYNLYDYLTMNSPKGSEIVVLDKITDGAACTTLLAQKYFNNNEPLLIANSDQIVEWDSEYFFYKMRGLDGGILTFPASDPKWSYARTDDEGRVIEVAEKRVISNQATVGIYYWNKGSDYKKYAWEMIYKEIRTNNEFYVCPVFNEAIAAGKTFGTCNIEKMWGLGTPEDLKKYVNERTTTTA